MYNNAMIGLQILSPLEVQVPRFIHNVQTVILCIKFYCYSDFLIIVNNL